MRVHSRYSRAVFGLVPTLTHEIFHCRFILSLKPEIDAPGLLADKQAMTVALLVKARRKAAKLLPRLGKNVPSFLLTHRGRPKAYLVEAGAYEAMQRRLTVLEGIALGEQDVHKGHLLTQAEVEKRLAKWLK